jgi:TRAP-type C4-dicarboxylate transport system permease large subunit
VVKTIEIGLLTPPVGMQVHVVTRGGRRHSAETVFRGCFWFLACEFGIMTRLIAFPAIFRTIPHAMF